MLSCTPYVMGDVFPITVSKQSSACCSKLVKHSQIRSQKLFGTASPSTTWQSAKEHLHSATQAGLILNYDSALADLRLTYMAQHDMLSCQQHYN